MEYNLLNQIKSNWMILTFLVLLIIGYTNQNSDIAQAKSDINSLKSLQMDISDLKIKVERIDTTVQFIKDKVQ